MRSPRTAAPSWRVVRPNAPVPGPQPEAAPVPLHILHVPLSPGRAGGNLPRTLFQGVGPILVEVPLADEVVGTPALLGFTALGRR
ncbi:MAG: hypothetical protein VKS61_01225 [Candidatus Sericytochromatia bacterium]|nr:hypothetical protein [Candidatus Sericytochromatia bacterium]